MEITSQINKQKTAIVVVGYNRLNSIQRLLLSLEHAVYQSNDIPLVISIDASGDKKLYDYVREFDWKHGEKYTIIHEERMGLKKHIFACGDLTQYFRAIILLEDDLYVSPYFYEYVNAALGYYNNDNKAACIGLYSYASNIYAALPFLPLQTEYDTYGIQATITWGECWNERMWNDFQNWMKANPVIEWTKLDIPSTVKNFKRAWSKFFTAYLSCSNRYVIVPYKSYTTNFTEPGDHNKSGSTVVQVPYVRRHENFKFGPVDDLVKYNSFFNPVGLEKFLPELDGSLYVNLYGLRENVRECRYELTTDVLPYKILKTFALQMKPIEVNVIMNVEGEGIFLYDLSKKEPNGKTDINPIHSIEYRLAMFRPRLLFKYIKNKLLGSLKKFLRLI